MIRKDLTSFPLISSDRPIHYHFNGNVSPEVTKYFCLKSEPSDQNRAKRAVHSTSGQIGPILIGQRGAKKKYSVTSRGFAPSMRPHLALNPSSSLPALLSQLRTCGLHSRFLYSCLSEIYSFALLFHKSAMATIIDGKAIAQSIRDDIATEVKSLSSSHNLVLFLSLSPPLFDGTTQLKDSSC